MGDCHNKLWPNYLDNHDGAAPMTSAGDLIRLTRMRGRGTAVAAEPRRRLLVDGGGVIVAGPSTLDNQPSTLWNWWAATVLPRALRFKRPLHRCNACSPTRCQGQTEPAYRIKWSERPVTLRLVPAPEAGASLLGYALGKMDGHQGIAPRIPVRKVLADGHHACISQHLCPDHGVPYWSRTSLCGFAGRRLNCSANGTEMG